MGPSLKGGGGVWTGPSDTTDPHGPLITMEHDNPPNTSRTCRTENSPGSGPTSCRTPDLSLQSGGGSLEGNPVTLSFQMDPLCYRSIMLITTPALNTERPDSPSRYSFSLQLLVFTQKHSFIYISHCLSAVSSAAPPTGQVENCSRPT